MNPSDKATSFRLKELKPILQEEAMKIDRSMHWLVIKVLKEYIADLKKRQRV